MSALPELPAMEILYSTTNRDGDPHHIRGHTTDQLREYGDARAAHARKQALEEAAKVCDLAITQNNETETQLVGLEKLVTRSAAAQAKKLAEAIRSLK